MLTRQGEEGSGGHVEAFVRIESDMVSQEQCLQIVHDCFVIRPDLSFPARPMTSNLDMIGGHKTKTDTKETRL